MKEITILVFSVTCVPGSGSPLKVPSVTSLAFTSRPETETHFYGYFYPSVENSGAVPLQHSKHPSIFWPLQHFHCSVHSDLYEREKTHSTYPITGKPIKSTDVDQENKKEKTRKGKQKFKTKKKVESSRGQQRTAKQFYYQYKLLHMNKWLAHYKFFRARIVHFRLEELRRKAEGVNKKEKKSRGPRGQ